jgi:chromosome segregation ATPase
VSNVNRLALSISLTIRLMPEIHDDHGTRTSKVAERDADHDLPFLEDKIQKLTDDVIELEWKKKDLNNTITLWNAQLRDLGQTIEQYQKASKSRSNN